MESPTVKLLPSSQAPLNSVPLIWTEVPPAEEPVLGLREDIVGPAASSEPGMSKTATSAARAAPTRRVMRIARKRSRITMAVSMVPPIRALVMRVTAADHFLRRDRITSPPGSRASPDPPGRSAASGDPPPRGRRARAAHQPACHPIRLRPTPTNACHTSQVPSRDRIAFATLAHKAEMLFPRNSPRSGGRPTDRPAKTEALKNQNFGSAR
jgi:hypothetical protein